MTGSGTLLLDDLMRFKPEGVTANGWAVKAGVSRTIWFDLRRHGNPSRKTLEKLLSAAGSSLAEFEALRVGDKPSPAAGSSAGIADPRPGSWRPAPLPPIPLLETLPAGEWGEPGSGIELIQLRLGKVSGEVARPASMAEDRAAYALTNLGEAMWPRFRPGRRLLVSPVAAIATGDDVVVQLRTASEAGRAVNVLVKELVRRSAKFIELRQFNPDVTFRVPAADIAALHKVVGEAI